MSKPLKISLIAAFTIAALIMGGQWWVKKSIEKRVAEIDVLDVDGLSISLLRRCANFDTLHYRENTDGQDSALQVKLFDGEISRISVLEYLKGGKFHFRACHVDSASIWKPGASHRAKAGYVLIEGSDVTIDDVKLFSIYSKQNFAAQTKELSSIMDLQIPRIRVQGFNLSQFVAENNLIFDSVHIQNPAITMTEDASVETCEDCIKKFPTQSLQSFSTPTTCKYLKVTEGKLTYEQINAKTDEIASLPFTNIYISAYNVTNDSISINNKDQMVVDIVADMDRTIPVDAHFNFDLTSSDGDFTLNGEIAPFDMKELNSFFKLANKFGIESGRSEKLNYDIDFADSIFEGEMEFEYKDLEIALLKEDMTKKKLLTGVVNILLSRDDNPPAGKLRVGNIYLNHDPNRSFFYHWVKSVQSGLASVVLPNLVLPKELKHESVDNKSSQ